MRSSPYWIDAVPEGQLCILPRPRAGDWLEDEILAWQAAGIDTVVSLLERGETQELGLGDEVPLCARWDLNVAWPVRDHRFRGAGPPLQGLRLGARGSGCVPERGCHLGKGQPRKGARQIRDVLLRLIPHAGERMSRGAEAVDPCRRWMLCKPARVPARRFGVASGFEMRRSYTSRSCAAC
jgi:hypothetical protein